MSELVSNPTAGGKAADAEIVSLSLDFGTYSNTFEYSLLYSLRKKNFVKGYSHKGLHWSVDYRIYPGKYILFHSRGYLDKRGAILWVSLIYINKQGEIKALETVKAGYVIPGSSDNIAVQKFLDALPGYHEKLVIPHLEGEGPTWEEIKKAVQRMNRKPTDPEA